VTLSLSRSDQGYGPGGDFDDVSCDKAPVVDRACGIGQQVAEELPGGIDVERARVN
jgi:hypothetical protein